MIRFWTPAEDAFIRANYQTMPCKEVAAKLDRTRSAVYARAVSTLKLHKRDTRLRREATTPLPKARGIVAKPFTFDTTPCSERELGWKR